MSKCPKKTSKLLLTKIQNYGALSKIGGHPQLVGRSAHKFNHLKSYANRKEEHKKGGDKNPQEMSQL